MTLCISNFTVAKAFSYDSATKQCTVYQEIYYTSSPSGNVLTYIRWDDYAAATCPNTPEIDNQLEVLGMTTTTSTTTTTPTTTSTTTTTTTTTVASTL